MSLWLNKKEKDYLQRLVEQDFKEKLPSGILTYDQREKLLGKIKTMKV